MAAGDESCGPRGLKVEAARDAIDVEHLAREMHSRDDAAFHRAEVDLAEGDAPARDKLLLERARRRP